MTRQRKTARNATNSPRPNAEQAQSAGVSEAQTSHACMHVRACRSIYIYIYIYTYVRQSVCM
jgi:hypothetical protein